MRQKKQDKIRFIKIILSAAVIILAIAILCRVIQKLMLSNEYFNIRFVTIKAEGDTDRFYDFVNNKALGKNIFAISLNVLSRDVIAKFPDVSGVILTRRFPNKIEADIILRKPLAKVSLSSGGSYYLDKDANLVLATSALDKFDNLPIVNGLGIAPSKTSLRNIVGLLDSINTVAFGEKLDLTKINIDERGELIFFLKQGLYVKVGSSEFEKRLERLKSLLDDSNFDIAKAEYIDIRFKEPSVIYKKTNSK